MNTAVWFLICLASWSLVATSESVRSSSSHQPLLAVLSRASEFVLVRWQVESLLQLASELCEAEPREKLLKKIIASGLEILQVVVDSLTLLSEIVV